MSLYHLRWRLDLVEQLEYQHSMGLSAASELWEHLVQRDWKLNGKKVHKLRSSPARETLQNY